MGNKRMTTFSLPGDSNNLVIFIHGYTGGPTDFSDVPERLNKELGVTAICQTLVGHGTRVEDLMGVSMAELLAPVEEKVKEALSENKKVVLVGLSMGAQMAIYLASKYSVAGVVAIGTTHTFSFPFNIPGASILGLFKRKWKKRFTNLGRELRAKAIFYEYMLFDGFAISRQLHALVERRLAFIRQPILFVHAKHDRLGNHKGVKNLSKRIQSKTSCKLLESASHNVFYSEIKSEVSDIITTFIKEEGFFEARDVEGVELERATAIVPAYNEAERISGVLAELTKSKLIDEVIVVDDGSIDGTKDKVRAFPSVKLLQNEKNLGKAASMNKGVGAAKNDIIFFCDADLEGFRAEHADAIIAPVRARDYDMYIGMRGNFMQRAVRAWGLNSGERALRKYVWEKLPNYYKYRYRVEAGLNHYVRRYTTNGLGWSMFDYAQPIKEKKHGLIKGTLLRWWMNFDVVVAYMSFPFIARFAREKHK